MRQEFHPFYHSLIKKLPWWWKTCQTHLASISGVNKHLLSRQWFYTVTRTFLQIELANMHSWNIFLIKAASMLASTQIKMVKPPDKKPGISNMGRLFCVFVPLISVHLAKAVLQHSPGQATSKACWLMWFILKIPKILCVFTQNVPCKFTLALGLKTIPARKVAIIRCFKWPNSFYVTPPPKLLHANQK